MPKKVKAVKTETSARGNTYVLTATGVKHLQDISGQGALIRNTIKASKKPLTSSEIAERLGKALKAPNPLKTIQFHLCVWKADGLVKFGPKK